MARHPLETTTFGIELEFLVRYKKSENSTLVNQWFSRHSGPFLGYRKLVQEEVVDVLRDKGFGVNDSSLARSPKLWTVKDDSSVSGAGGYDELFVTDGSIPSNEFKEVGMEITSPVLEDKRESFDKISDLLKALKRHFDCIINETCGFHVHVGNAVPNSDLSQSQGFSLQTAKNLLGLGFQFERQINRIHPRHRIGNEYCPPLTQIMSERNSWRLWCDLEDEKVMEEIANLDSINAVTYGIGGKRSAYNFNNLLPLELSDHNPPLNTIEFRQHEGTLDSDSIYHWVQVVVSMVKNPQSSSPLDVDKLTLLNIEDTGSDTAFFLKGIGCGSQAEYYEDKLYEHE